MPSRSWSCALASLAVLAWATAPVLAQGSADSIGSIKRLQGGVTLQRGALSVPLRPGTAVQVGDRLVTAADGTVGLTLGDDTRLTAGPSSTLVISAFSFDTTTHEGGLLATLLEGTLHVVTGALAKQTPLSVNVQTPHALLGARGTEFIVDARGDAAGGTP
jgi:hypothetical protein